MKTHRLMDQKNREIISHLSENGRMSLTFSPSGAPRITCGYMLVWDFPSRMMLPSRFSGMMRPRSSARSGSISTSNSA